jgi:hypothetical protein
LTDAFSKVEGGVFNAGIVTNFGVLGFVLTLGFTTRGGVVSVLLTIGGDEDFGGVDSDGTGNGTAVTSAVACRVVVTAKNNSNLNRA